MKAMAPVDVDHLGRVDEELLVRVHGEQHVAHVCLEQKHLTLLSGRKKRQGTCACLPLMYPNPSGPISNFLAYDRRDLHRLLLFLYIVDIVVPFLIPGFLVLFLHSYIVFFLVNSSCSHVSQEIWTLVKPS